VRCFRQHYIRKKHQYHIAMWKKEKKKEKSSRSKDYVWCCFLFWVALVLRGITPPRLFSLKTLLCSASVVGSRSRQDNSRWRGEEEEEEEEVLMLGWVHTLLSENRQKLAI